MGDDLIFAQKFTRTAADGLALLVEMEDPRAKGDARVVVNMMTTVQRGAKRLRARHIYTGAQDVLSALHHYNDETLSSRIVTLGSLVTEYARGLDELLRETEAAPAATPVDKWDQARETLNGLLPVASSADADMLSRLMRAPVTLETVQPDEAASPAAATVVPFARAAASQAETPVIDDLSFDLTDAEDAPLAGDTAPNPGIAAVSPALQSHKGSGSSVTLDTMIRDVIPEALAVARSVGRTISLSYDMGDRSVSDVRAANLRGRLNAALAQIIRQSLTDGRVGHIDINLAGEQLHIMAGTTAVRIAIDPEQAPAAKPLITPETEQGLRSQLDALMDPAARHETAS